MSDAVESAVEKKASRREAHHLLRWIRDNPGNWEQICGMENSDFELREAAELVEKLYQDKLYSLMLIVIYNSRYRLPIDRAIDKTVAECFLDTPIDTLMERFCKNVELKVAEHAQ